MKTIKIVEDMDNSEIEVRREPIAGEARRSFYSRREAKELRDQLDEILGDRKPEFSTFTGESLSALCMALKDNPAAAAHLGLPPGGDVLRQIAEWAKSYRELDPGLVCANCGVTCSTGLPADFAFKGEVWCSSCYESRDEEIGRWQTAIRDEVIRLTGCPPEIVDGKGSDGDELAFTLAEIGQAICWLIDEHAPSDPPTGGEAAILAVLDRWAERQGEQEVADLTREAMEVLARKAWKAVAPFTGPEPSPDLKEALSAALRTWQAGDSMATSLGGAFGLAFGFRPAKTQEELDRLADHIAEAVAPAIHDCPPLGNQPPDLEGVARKVEAEAVAEDVEAAISAVLFAWFGDASRTYPWQLAELARKLAAALPPVASPEEISALNACIGSALAGTHALEGEDLEELQEDVRLANRLLGRLTTIGRWPVAPALPALTPEEAAAIRASAEAAAAWAPSRTTEAAWQLIEQAKVAVAAAERLSGAGAPDAMSCARCGHPAEAHDNNECLYGLPDFECLCEGFLEDLGRKTGVQRFDPRVPEQTLDAIIDLGRRICVLEGWRRSCAHLPADEEALGALVDEAVERALRPVAHRMSDLESMKINLQGRVHALELHRQGLTDGQAEAATKPCPRKIEMPDGRPRSCVRLAGHDGPCV